MSTDVKAVRALLRGTGIRVAKTEKKSKAKMPARALDLDIFNSDQPYNLKRLLISASTCLEKGTRLIGNGYMHIDSLETAKKLAAVANEISPGNATWEFTGQALWDLAAFYQE